MEWYLKVLRQYADFEGRARRKEYWMFVLFNLVISFVLGFVDGMVGLKVGEAGVGVLSTLYSLAVLVPGIAVSVRRLHDIGKSGWMLLVAFIPCLGALILLFWVIKEGDKGPNAYGSDPKAGAAA